MIETESRSNLVNIRAIASEIAYTYGYEISDALI